MDRAKGKLIKTDKNRLKLTGKDFKPLRALDTVDDVSEGVFLFRANDLRQARQLIEKVHGQVLIEDPQTELFQITFLKKG